jgi:hypothetical protein
VTTTLTRPAAWAEAVAVISVPAGLMVGGDRAPGDGKFGPVKASAVPMVMAPAKAVVRVKVGDGGGRNKRIEHPRGHSPQR